MMLDGELLLQLVEENPNFNIDQEVILEKLMFKASIPWISFHKFEWKEDKKILVLIEADIASFICVNGLDSKSVYNPEAYITNRCIENPQNFYIVEALKATNWKWMDRKI